MVGSACFGSNGLPALTSNDPHLGNPALVLDLVRGRPAAPCAFAFAAATQNLSLGGGCTLYLREPIVPLLHSTNGAGFASVRLAVPADPSLHGATLHAQALFADPQSQAFGVTFTAGRRLVLGD